MRELSVEDFLISALQNTYRLALEGQVYRRIVSTDPLLQKVAESTFASPEHARKLEKLNSQIQKLRESALNDNSSEVAGILGTMSGDVNLQ
jgi:hypothetical protein